MAVVAFTAVAWRSQEARTPAASAPRASQAPASQAPFDVEAIVRQVRFAYQPEQDGWRGGHSTYDVKATAQGLTMTPLHYKNVEPEARELPGARPSAPLPPQLELETGAPLFLGPASVARGDVRLSEGAPRGKVETDGHLAFQHGEFVEHLRNSEQGVEQSWSFDTAPAGQGALRVDIPVKGLVHTGTSPQGLHFADARTGMGIRYGHGTWVDAKGRRTAIPAEYVHGQIQLSVPEQVLASSSWPAVLDPVISSEMLIDGRLTTAELATKTLPVLAFNGTNYLLVWRDQRAGLYNLHGTRVSSTGTVLDSTGFVVSTGPGHSADPQVASNGTDFFVVWNQYHSGYWGMRGTRVSSAGVVSDPGGKNLSTTGSSQVWPHLASNGTDYLVTWYAGGADGFHNVFARRISSTGQWLDTSDISIAAGLNYDETSAVVASNGTVYLVAWSDWRSGSSRVYATRVSNAGVVLDGTGFPLSSNDTQYMQAMASNGADFLAVWLDYRNTGTRDLYATRVTGSGTVVDGTGLAVATTSSVYETYASAASNGTDYFVSWTGWTTSPSNSFQVLGSRISASASSSSAVLDTTSLVFSANTTHQRSSVAPAGSGYLVAWQGPVTGGTDLYNAWVSSSGTITTGSGFPITASASSLYQVEPAVASNGTNYLVVWRDDAPTQQIRGVRVSREGGVLDMPGLEITSYSQERRSPAVASNGTDYFVAWEDNRNGNWDIYGARVLGTAASSSAVQDPNGFAISTHSAFQNVPAVASNGTNYFVVWRQDPGGGAAIYGARVTSAGVVQDTSGIAIDTTSVEHYTPRVTFNGTNYFAVWAEYQSATNWDIHGTRVSTAGSVLDTPSITIRGASADQYEPDVASNGTDFLVVWTNWGSSGADIHGARVSGAGAVLDTTPLVLCSDSVQQFSPRVVFDGTNYMSAWADYRWDDYWDVYGTPVTGSGSVVTPDGFSIVYNARNTEPFIALASAGSQQSFVTFSRYDTQPGTGHRRIRGTFFSF